MRDLTVLAVLRAATAVERLIRAARPCYAEVPVCWLAALLEAVSVADTGVAGLAAVADIC